MIARVFFTLATILMVMLLLYFGKPVLIPVALSVLLAFILTPLVDVLEGWRLSRTPAVLLATGLAFAIIAMAIWALVSQATSLAAELPNHKNEIQAKLSALKVDEGSTYGRLSEMFRELLSEEEPSAASAENADADPAELPVVYEVGVEPPAPATPPAPIVVAAERESTFTSAIDILLPIVEPLATAALVVVLVMFLLFRREDVRYRMISLMGDAALTGTTRLMRDTAERVSKYLLNLMLVNAAFGLWFGLGLYLLGVPYAPLWGFLTLCLRFIPFLGSPASVLFPLLVSFATSSGWGQPIAVLVFFVTSELVTSNIIEPILFGKTTGLTPIALLIAALFWAWIWGPIGLLLSTPLTVCLVVMGQHLPHLRSLKVLLAEQPVLDARLQFFQRLLAGDAAEAGRVFRRYVDTFGRSRAFDEVLLPALAWTRLERSKESITSEEEHFIWQSTREAIRQLPAEPQAAEGNSNDSSQPAAFETAASPQPAAAPAGAGNLQSASSVVAVQPTAVDAPASTTSPSSTTAGEETADTALTADPESRPDGPRPRVYGYPVHHESEEVALAMLERLLEQDYEVRSCTTRILPSKALTQIAQWQPQVVVLAVLPPGGLPQVKYMCREIHQRCPEVHIMVAYLGKVKDYDSLLVKVREVGASYLTTSLTQTTHQIQGLREDHAAP